MPATIDRNSLYAVETSYYSRRFHLFALLRGFALFAVHDELGS